MSDELEKLERLNKKIQQYTAKVELITQKKKKLNRKKDAHEKIVMGAKLKAILAKHGIDYEDKEAVDMVLAHIDSQLDKGYPYGLRKAGLTPLTYIVAYDDDEDKKV